MSEKNQDEIRQIAAYKVIKRLMLPESGATQVTIHRNRDRQILNAIMKEDKYLVVDDNDNVLSNFDQKRLAEANGMTESEYCTWLRQYHQIKTTKGVNDLDE